jgi:hypothetical protein
MEKNFDGWNRSKKKIHEAAKRPFYHAREIWWCAIGANIGNELDGTGRQHDRPVVSYEECQMFLNLCNE